MLSVSDLLKSKGRAVWSIGPEETTADALKLLAEKNIGALVVVEQGEVVGIVSERDFVRRMAEEGGCQMDQPVRQSMSSPVFTIRTDQSIEAVMELMTQKHIRHLPVVDANGLAGLISIGDVVKAMLSDQEWTIRNLENYIQGGR